MRSPTSLHSFTTRVTLQVLAGNYVLCALTKLINSNGAWIWNSQYMPVQYAKIQAQNYYTTLEHPDLGLGGALNELCTQHPWLCMLVYAPGLIVELFAFLMLFGRVWMLLTGLAVVAMHALVDVTMNLGFPQHQWIFYRLRSQPALSGRPRRSRAFRPDAQRHPASEMRRNNTGS